MINCQKFNFLLFLTINSVTIGVRELNGTSQISLVTHDAKGEMREIKMRYCQFSRECHASSNFCHLLITFENSLDPDQDQQNDLDPNSLTF